MPYFPVEPGKMLANLDKDIFLININRINSYIKKAIKEDRAKETCSFTNDLHDALLQKQNVEFWKTWNSKFEKNIYAATIINGQTSLI
jgi:hypothetical protein